MRITDSESATRAWEARAESVSRADSEFKFVRWSGSLKLAGPGAGPSAHVSYFLGGRQRGQSVTAAGAGVAGPGLCLGAT